MTVTVQINGTTLNPQPADTRWDTMTVGGKLDGTDTTGAYLVHILSAPVDNGGTANWNWTDYDNTVLTSIATHAPFDTMRDTATTYNSGVVSKPIKTIRTEPGGIVTGVEMRVLVVV